MIICAAIELTMNNMAQTKLIICGLRHADCFETIHALNDNWKFATKVQGFIDHKGNFLNRQEALIHARECGQLSITHEDYQKEHCLNELYSEDLY